MRTSLLILSIAVLCVLSGAIGGYMGVRAAAPEGSHLTARFLSITDDTGAVRIQLGLSDDTPLMRFFAPDGTAGSVFGQVGLQIPTEDGGFFGLAKIEETPSLYFVNSEGMATTSISPTSWSLSNGKNRNMLILAAFEKGINAGFYYGEHGSLNLSLWDDIPTITLGHSPEKAITLKSSDQAQFFSMTDSLNGFGSTLINSKEGSSFFISDEKNEPRYGAMVDSDGPTVNLMDENGVSRLQLGTSTLTDIETDNDTTTAEANLVMFDKESKVVWQAP